VTVDGTLYSPPPRALPNAEQLHSYLRFTGWQQLPAGPAGSFWMRDSARIGVPHEDDEFMIKGSIERYAIQSVFFYSTWLICVLQMIALSLTRYR